MCPASIPATFTLGFVYSTALPASLPSSASIIGRSGPFSSPVVASGHGPFTPESNFFTLASESLTRLCPELAELCLLLSDQRRFSTASPRRVSCWPACVALRCTGIPEPVNGLRHHCCGRWCRRNHPGGFEFPSSTIQRAWHRIGNRESRAIQPVSNAYEDAAQTTGGRNTHGDKSGRG